MFCGVGIVSGSEASDSLSLCFRNISLELRTVTRQKRRFLKINAIKALFTPSREQLRTEVTPSYFHLTDIKKGNSHFEKKS